MNELTISLDGKETKIKIKEIDIDDIALDELNPRISFFRDNQNSDKLSNDEVIFALTQKKPEAFRKLKDSIHPIWIEPLKSENSKKYRVIEGNTRVVAYKQLKGEEPNETKWKTILSNILPHTISEEQKNFIRLLSHLRGTTEWDAYEKAKYLYKLWNEEGWSQPRLEKQTKMSLKQIDENIEAYRIMERQYLPVYGDDPNEVTKFSYFVEYEKNPKLQSIMLKNDLHLSDMCEWVGEGKINRALDVRFCHLVGMAFKSSR